MAANFWLARRGIAEGGHFGALVCGERDELGPGTGRFQDSTQHGV